MAEVALRDAKIAPTTLLKKASLILMGKDSREEDWDMALAAVDKGANLVLQLDSSSNDMLIKKGLLNEPITAWGGLQTAHWAGNGSSYIDVFAGNQPLPSSGTISTRSWEASGNPVGFYPFRSNYKQRAYGLYFAHQYK